MKTYELTYIISPGITQEEAESKNKEIGDLITNKEGLVLKQINPSAKTLSYPIKRQASGFMGVLEFQLEPEKLVELKSVLSKDRKIIRHVVIIKEASQFKKERRTRAPKIETKIKKEEPSFVKASEAKEKEKVELKDIEQTLDEILGQ